MSNPITYKTMTLAECPDRRAEFWDKDELILVIHFSKAMGQGNVVDLLAEEWLSAGAGNCVNICS